MKRLWTILILLSVMTVGYSQDKCKECPGVLLGKSYQAVQNNFKPYQDYYLIEVSDTSLVYYNWADDVTKTYIFKWYKGRRHCINCIFTLDCMSGEELIAEHESDCSWDIISESEWLYDTQAYDIPLTVTLKYVDGFMAFSYRYIPDYKLTGH